MWSGSDLLTVKSIVFCTWHRSTMSVYSNTGSQQGLIPVGRAGGRINPSESGLYLTLSLSDAVKQKKINYFECPDNILHCIVLMPFLLQRL